MYDSDSRLVRGHPTKPKAVIDYIVLERNLTLDESSWRIAGKLPPLYVSNIGYIICAYCMS